MFGWFRRKTQSKSVPWIGDDLRVEVTQADIDHGIRNSTYLCPVALALSRKFGDRPIVVTGDGVVIYNDYSAAQAASYFTFPNKATTFIINFDVYGPDHVEPITFDLEPPREHEPV